MKPFKVSSVRFAYSVKVGNTEVTYASEDKYILDFKDGFLTIALKEDPKIKSLVPLTNIPYLVEKDGK